MINLPSNIKEIISAFEEWYKNDPHSEFEDYYQKQLKYDYINNLSEENFLAFFLKFTNEGGKVQSQGQRNAGKLINSIKERYEEFKQGILEPFSDNFNIQNCLNWADNFKFFGKGLATIYLHRTNKTKFIIVNDKSINACQKLGYSIRKSGLENTYNDILQAQTDSDLKQMFTYNLFWKSDKAFLVYPGNKTKLFEGRYFDHPNAKEISKLEANMLFVNIFKDETDELDGELGQKIYEILVGQTDIVH